MRYLTPRKRAIGKGASHTGTEHHWHMTVSAVALAFMVPTWIYIFGSALGRTQDEVVAIFARPFPAILTALILIVGMRHFAKGAQMTFEDYAHGFTREALIMATNALSYLTIAAGFYALVKLAL